MEKKFKPGQFVFCFKDKKSPPFCEITRPKSQCLHLVVSTDGTVVTMPIIKCSCLYFQEDGLAHGMPEEWLKGFDEYDPTETDH
jgi:hypothetical protein